ncbi:hypothetical protein V8E53_006054 [Lactarius tabidus]
MTSSIALPLPSSGHFKKLTRVSLTSATQRALTASSFKTEIAELCVENFEEHAHPYYAAELAFICMASTNDFSWHFRTRPPAVLDGSSRTSPAAAARGNKDSSDSSCARPSDAPQLYVNGSSYFKFDEP